MEELTDPTASVPTSALQGFLNCKKRKQQGGELFSLLRSPLNALISHARTRTVSEPTNIELVPEHSKRGDG